MHQNSFSVDERCAVVKKDAGNCDIVILSFPIEKRERGGRVFIDIVVCKAGLIEKIENILIGKELQYYFNRDLAMEFGFDVLSLTSSSGGEAEKIGRLIAKSLTKKEMLA